MKKTWFLVGALMLLITTYEIISSYAKYTSEATGTIEKNAGAWMIKVNDSNIATGNLETTFNIDSLTYPSNDLVAENKIAPSSSGYFDVEIDATGSSVAVRYDITLDTAQMNISEGIHFQNAYKVVNNSEVSEGIIRTGANTYSGIISLNSIQNGEKCKLRFYIGWDEDESGESDENDSVLGHLKDISTSLPVEVVVTQYLGEEIS
ncbi:MAG: hypothetical protein IKG56_02660 [Clostridia bacterium]|nr:hypothetical protein [Clostridia bacterium]